VVADRAPVAKNILAVGSINWLEHSSFDLHDLSRLLVHRTQLPGATEDTRLVVVSRSGCDVDGVTAYDAEGLARQRVESSALQFACELVSRHEVPVDDRNSTRS
jgi:hypothetical protein